MREAVTAGISTEVEPYVPVQPICQCVSKPFRTDTASLCDSLFTPIPPGMDPEDQIPSISIWKDGVEMVSAFDGGENKFTFTIEEEEEGDPKRPDVILYEGRFYVIGEVHTVIDPYLEIEPEMIWVYPDWAVDNDVYSNTRWNVK